ncbi:MAG: BamA/TamA family outer membrane protein [Bacteroidales bacterium]|nr:BamA/TamA family outer membrane protein [Bacteroidales bacterium]
MFHLFSLQRFRQLTLLLLLFLMAKSISAGNEPDTLLREKSPYLVIGKIEINGNKLTRRKIITRELKFHEGDTVLSSALPTFLVTGKENVFNTRLFNFVTFDTVRIPGTVVLDIHITVIERWYIWPIPYFEIGDRNINVWWETRDFSRLTYGVDFTFFNVRGRNETLKILTHFGFNKKFGFNYTVPYVNEKQTVGLGFGAEVDLNHEVPVTTIENQPVFEKDASSYLKQLRCGYLELRVRPNIYALHTLRCSYYSYYFADRVLAIPGFSLSNSNFQNFFSFNYLYKDDHRDIHYYPLTGYYFDAELNFSVPYSFTHNGYLKINLRKYWQLSKRWYFASGFTGKGSIEQEQPYFLAQGLGYGRDMVRGYEYFVIDGQHFALLKNNLKFALFPSRVCKLKFIHSSKFNTLPLALYLNLYMDLGYVYNYGSSNQRTHADYGNTLQNQLLAGFGSGLDFTTYYDIVIRMEFSVNAMGRPGFYLHFIAPI